MIDVAELERAIKERLRKREEVIRAVGNFALKASQVLGPLTAILYGSYARGDFNLWSDVDVLFVVRDEVALPRKPHKRVELVLDLVPPGFEVHLVREGELRRALAKRAFARAALAGAVVVLDQLGLAEELRAMGLGVEVGGRGAWRGLTGRTSPPPRQACAPRKS